MYKTSTLTTILSCILALSNSAIAEMKQSVDPVFKTSIGGETDAALNRMWDVYGRIVDGAVQRFGNEPSYFEMIGQKLMWSDLEDDKETFREKLRDHPCNEDGYLWSWATEEGWPTHHARHYENNAKYILGIYRYISWIGDTDFLNEKDQTTSTSIFPEQIDVSEGMTVLEKLHLAMQFQLEQMEGKNGLALITDPEVDGTVNGKPSDYWDNLLTGYKTAFVNIYFYASLEAVAQIEDSIGKKEAAIKLRAIAEQVKINFNKTFWNPETQRYVMCVDRTGRMWDFGFTFANTEAIFYGLADRARAQIIYEWLDGKRIVESDIQMVNGKQTGSTGADIYALKWAPRSNTRAIESVQVDSKYWWWDIGGAITVGGKTPSASWLEHLENGGAIFYTSYYDILSRIKTLGADDAWNRFNAILKEFAIDELRRDPDNNVGAPWKWGITGEFPESGLVPVTMVHGFMGLSADIDSLNIEPVLPPQLKECEVRSLVYKNTRHRIIAKCNPEGQVTFIGIDTEKAGTARNIVLGNLIPDGNYTLTIGKKSEVVTADKDGKIKLNTATADQIELRM